MLRALNTELATWETLAQVSHMAHACMHNTYMHYSPEHAQWRTLLTSLSTELATWETLAQVRHHIVNSGVSSAATVLA
jgi:hypothetical protein